MADTPSPQLLVLRLSTKPESIPATVVPAWMAAEDGAQSGEETYILAGTKLQALLLTGVPVTVVLTNMAPPETAS